VCDDLQSLASSPSLTGNTELYGDVVSALDRVDGCYTRLVVPAVRPGVVVPGIVDGIDVGVNSNGILDNVVVGGGGYRDNELGARDLGFIVVDGLAGSGDSSGVAGEEKVHDACGNW